MKRLMVFVLAFAIAVLGTMGYKWHTYVTNTASAFDEVGSTLNRYMPGPLNAWGCAQLKKNFGRGLPPMGCEGTDGRSWRV
jgi:hypothetical protein